MFYNHIALLLALLHVQKNIVWNDSEARKRAPPILVDVGLRANTQISGVITMHF